jgi:hypothetical protein
VFFHVYAGFAKGNTFGFKQFALQAGERLADQQFSAITDDAVPGNTLAGGTCRHGAASTACSSAEAKHFGEPPISDNPAAGNSFHECMYRSPGHRCINSLRILREAITRRASLQQDNIALGRTSNVQRQGKKSNEALTRESKFSQPC